MSVELIVFDCDGVLVDSEALVVEVEAAMLSKAGFPVSAADITERYVGISYSSMMADLAKRNGRPIPDALSRRIQQAALDEFPDRLQPVPGMPELLGRLDRRRCVASSSDLHRIHLSLSVTGLAGYFQPDWIFSAEMVANGKPAPDLFELAAATLGVKPSACLVIEDSPAGVTAAIAAGMEVVGLVAGGHATASLADRLRAAGAELILDTVGALDTHLASL